MTTETFRYDEHGPYQLMAPSATRDFGVDLTDWLTDGETVTAGSVTVTGGTKLSESHTATEVVAWIQSGAAGTIAALFSFTTSAGRVDSRQIRLKVGVR